MVNFSIKTWIATKPFQYDQQTSVTGPIPIFIANGWIIGYGVNKNKYDYVRFDIADWASREFIPKKFIQTTNGYIYFIGKVNTTVDYFTLQRSVNNGESWTSLGDSTHEFYALTEYYANSYLYIEEAITGRMDIRLTGTGGPTNWKVVDNTAKIGNTGVVIAGTGAFPVVNKNFVFIDETDYKIIETELDPLQTVTTRYTGDATNQPKEIIVLVDGVYYAEFYTGTAYEVRSVDLSAGTTAVITGTTGLHLYASDATYIYLSNIGRTGEYGDLRIYRYSTADGLELIYLLPIDGLVGIHGIAIEPVTGDLAVEFSNLLGTVYNNYQLVYTTNSRFRSCIVESEINGKMTKAILSGAKSDISSIPLNIRAQIKNESDEVVFDGYCVQIQNNSLALFEGVDREILKKDANISILAQDASEVFTALLLVNDETFAGTLAAGGNTYTQTWSNMKQGHVMLTLAQARAALFRSFIDIADSNKTKFDLILLSALTSSGIELTDANRSTYAYQMKMIEGSDKPEAVNKLILQGATNSNGTLQKTQGSGLPEKIIKRPDICDAQLLTDYSAQLYADRNISSSFSKRYEISINKNAPFLKVGDTILASFEREQIALDIFIVLNQKYNYALKQSKIIVSKAIGAQPLMENQAQKGLTTAIIASDNTTGTQIVPVSDVDIRAGKFTIPVTVGDPVGTQDAIPKHLYDDVKTTADAAFPNSIATAKILGRTSAGTGVVEQLDLEQTATDSAAKMSSSAAVYKQMPKSGGTFTGPVRHTAPVVVESSGSGLYNENPNVINLVTYAWNTLTSFGYEAHANWEAQTYNGHTDRLYAKVSSNILASGSCKFKQTAFPVGPTTYVSFYLNSVSAGFNISVKNGAYTYLGITVDISGYFEINGTSSTLAISNDIEYFIWAENISGTGVTVKIYNADTGALLYSNLFASASTHANTVADCWIYHYGPSGEIYMDRLYIGTSYTDSLEPNIGSITADSILVEQLTATSIEAKSQKVEDEGNFKNQYADDWGTSGTPSTFPDLTGTPETDEIVASYMGHNYPYHLVESSAVTDYRTKTQTLVNGFLSCWINKDSGNIYIVGEDSGATARLAVYMNTSEALICINGAGSAVTVMTLAEDVWYHIFLEWNKNTTSYLYVNGCMVHTFAAYNADIVKLRLQVNEGSSYFDAFYCGDSWLKAWSSMYDGHVADRARWTRYGERGYHSLQFKDRSIYDWRGVTATNGDNAILNLVTGAASLTGFDGAGESTTNHLADNRVPPNTRFVDLSIVGYANTGHTNNNFFVIRYGNANDNQNLGVYCFVNGAYNHNNGLVELGASCIHVKFIIGAGTDYLYVRIMGYVI